MKLAVIVLTGFCLATMPGPVCADGAIVLSAAKAKQEPAAKPATKPRYYRAAPRRAAPGAGRGSDMRSPGGGTTVPRNRSAP